MSNMINFSGQGLQRSYSGGMKTTISDKEREAQKKDFEALKKVQEAKRAEREARMNERENNRKPFDVKAEEKIKELEIDKIDKIETIKKMPELLEKEKINTVEKIINSKENEIKKQAIPALEKTNALARKYGLPEPNNPEALKHDRLHCYTCDRELHNPNAVKGTVNEGLYDDEEIRIMCCWCFGRMSEDDIKFTARSAENPTKEIRMQIYDPINGLAEKVEKQLKQKANETQKEYEHRIESARRAIPESIVKVEKMTQLEQIRLKSKIKQYKNVINMVGNVKHDYLFEGDQFENQVMYRAKTRYTACEGGL